ncbi:right-handed parallel beta-helix repeat-containing protein [Patescibacteria group bacterium]
MKYSLRLLLALLVLISFSSNTASAASYDAYVDDSNDTGIEDGTRANPYNTIMEAVDAVAENSRNYRRIYVSKGEYEEKVVLGDYVKLYGKHRNDVTIDGDDEYYTVKMKDHTLLKNVTINKGRRGILVDENSRASIKKVKVKKSDKIGIEILKSKTNKSERVTITDSKIYKSDGKGLYIKKGIVEIEDSEVYENDEEGIDLRSGVEGKISNNEIYENGESGIEIVVNKSDMKISNNTIEKNKTSGISVQYYKHKTKEGDIVIKRNDMTTNDKYGIKCGRPSGGYVDSSYWSENISLSENVNTDNLLGKYYTDCYFQ